MMSRTEKVKRGAGDCHPELTLDCIGGMDGGHGDAAVHAGHCLGTWSEVGRVRGDTPCDGGASKD